MIKNRHDLYYLLGFGFLDFHCDDSFHIVLRKPHVFRGIMSDLALNIFNKQISSDLRAGVELVIDDEDVIRFLYQEGINAQKRYMPSIIDEYAWSFIAGYFDSYGELSFKNDNPRVFIPSPLPDLIKFVAKHWQVEVNYRDKVLANGYKALDICEKMYENVTVKSRQKFNGFMDILNSAQTKLSLIGRECHFEYMKLHPSAIEPQKSYATDSAFDLHVVELTRLYTTAWGASVYQARTQLAVKPILGYAFDLNARSSIPKKGWQFMQGTGIVDCSYCGEIQGTLMKLTDDPMPELPWRALQLVPREKPVHAKFIEKKDLGESFRGTGGFGSTG